MTRSREHWEESYRTNFMPWDVGVAEPHLIEYVEQERLSPGRALEIGCGTGTNARWLAAQGFHVVAVDVAALAIERAKQTPAPARGSLELLCLDFLQEPVPGGPFDLVFDRGCFHTFDEPSERERFARRVAELLAPDGRWLSLIGSTEGPPRDTGPPRRSAKEIVRAIEPSLALVQLRTTVFDAHLDFQPRAWFCVAGQRDVPAQPSSRH
jgi:methyl halide transferase